MWKGQGKESCKNDKNYCLGVKKDLSLLRGMKKIQKYNVIKSQIFGHIMLEFEENG